MLVSGPFLHLFHLRRRYFSLQSRALYHRYAQALGIVLAFAGLVLVERPSLLAAPILHFAGAPSGWRADAAVAGAWLLAVALWARVHRDFVRGAALADFVRTGVHGRRLAPALDLALVLVSLQVAAIPFVIAAWTVAASDAAPSASALRFWPAFLLLLLMTVALARAVCFGADRATLLRQAVAFAALACAGQAGPTVGAAALLTATVLLAFDLSRPVAAQCVARRSTGASGVLRGPRLWFLLVLQWRALRRSHAHVALARIGCALLLHALCWYLVAGLGKRHDAAGFLKVAGCASSYALSSLYYAFWTARQPLQPYLRSVPHGEARVVLAEHLLVLAVGGAVYGTLLLAARMLLPDVQVVGMAVRIGAQALLLLPLLGAPILQRHRYGTPAKVALAVAALMSIQE